MTTLGSQTITARINWSYRYGEDNAYNNSTSTSATVNKYSHDYYVSFEGIVFTKGFLYRC